MRANRVGYREHLSSTLMTMSQFLTIQDAYLIFMPRPPQSWAEQAPYRQSEQSVPLASHRKVPRRQIEGAPARPWLPSRNVSASVCRPPRHCSYLPSRLWRRYPVSCQHQSFLHMPVSCSEMKCKTPLAGFSAIRVHVDIPTRIRSPKRMNVAAPYRG